MPQQLTAAACIAAAVRAARGTPPPMSPPAQLPPPTQLPLPLLPTQVPLPLPPLRPQLPPPPPPLLMACTAASACAAGPSRARSEEDVRLTPLPKECVCPSVAARANGSTPALPAIGARGGPAASHPAAAAADFGGRFNGDAAGSSGSGGELPHLGS